MSITHSADGTTLTYEKLGSGPSLILVDGAFCRRGFGPMAALAKALAPRFTVVIYDRRGRDESGDTAPYDPAREIEDLAAIVACVDGPPHLYAISSGVALTLRAIGAGLPVRRLVLYEAPFALDGTHVPDPPDYRERISSLLAAGDRDSAVKLFMRVVGVPAFGIFVMRWMPNVWPKLRAVAHTLAYDLALLGDTQRGGPLPDDLVAACAAVSVPTLSAAGGKSPPWMHHSAEVLARAIPGAVHELIPGQDHNIGTKAIAPVLERFFAAAG